jgi:predicted nucleotidyltransferase
VFSENVRAAEQYFMSLNDLLVKHRDTIQQIAKKHGVVRLRVFGSVARGDTTPNSDVDFLVETGPNTSAWFPAGLVLDLESLLGQRVEIVTERALRPELRESVLRDARPI